MKASYLVIVLLLSNVTLTSGFLCEFLVGSYVAALVGVFFASIQHASIQHDNVLPFDAKRLERDLDYHLYGQHIVSKVVVKAVSSFMTKSNPNKPLVLSFHGTTGVGKNHVAKIIARNIYQLGDQSSHVITFTSVFHFPHKELVHIYSAQLKQVIRQHVSSFPRSMFVFDEMDKMNPRLVETIEPFLDTTPYIDGVSYRKAIFIFLSNAGGDEINSIALDFWRAGRNREDLQIHNMKGQILQSIFDDESSLAILWQSHQHLVDHFIPFLPLEQRHVHHCVLAEMVYLNIAIDHNLVNTIANIMPYFPEKEKIFALKGCKSVRQKLMLYAVD